MNVQLGPRQRFAISAGLSLGGCALIHWGPPRGWLAAAFVFFMIGLSFLRGLLEKDGLFKSTQGLLTLFFFAFFLFDEITEKSALRYSFWAVLSGVYGLAWADRENRC